MSVCLSVTKMLTFRNQKIWSFLTFIATFCTQWNWPFHVSWHFCSQKIWPFLMFIDTFCFQKCQETVKRQNPLKYSKNLVDSPVSRHFLYSKVSGNSEMTKSLEIMTFQWILLLPLFQDTFGKGFVVSPVYSFIPYSK